MLMNSRLLIILISLLVFTLSCSDGTIIELTSPDGGETWHEQTTQKIKWETGFSVSQVDIYYSLDGGDTWYEIDDYNGSNEYNWETPSVSSDYESCLVKIYETDDETNYDISSNFFSIIADSDYFQITSPVSGNVWPEQTIQTITWNFAGDVDDAVRIYIDSDNNGEFGSITYNTNNDGTFEWTLGDYSASYDSARIRIESYDNSDEYDLSDYFSIIADSTYYSVTSPNGGETWEELSTQTITWESSGDASSNEYVYLYYSLDGGAEWIQLQWHSSSNPGTGWNNTFGNSGTYSWTLPEIFVTNTTCRMKVKQKYSPYVEDISDVDFTISAGSGQSDIMNVLSANGGEVWHELTSEEITWYTTGDIGGNEVYVGYSTDGGNYWYDAVDDGSTNYNEETTDPPYTYRWDVTSNDGSYSWSLPNFSDTLETCILGVWSAANTALYDMSDNYFTVTCDSNYYRILQPNGGETFQKETDRYILWESGGDVDDIEIYYSIFGGESWYLISNSQANDGSFIWPVPTVQGTNDACKIKIQSRDRDDWFDISDANFTIADTVIFDFDMSFETGESLAGWTFGDAWTVNGPDAFDGSRSAVCEGGDGTLSKTMTVNSGVMQFFYKTNFYSSSCSYDYLALKIDGEEIFKVCSPTTEIDWTLFEYYVDAGTYDFEWVYEYSSSSAYVRIDAISFP
jgi:hypothetical protein